jgi:hypothetical protein
MSVNIGIIAEENNDVEVLYELTCKIIEEKDFKFKKFIGHGCGTIRKKTNSWAKNLLCRGCSHLIILHDLDDYDEKTLRQFLDNLVNSLSFTGYIILIPIYEIESWLLYDSDAIRKVFNMRGKPKIPTNPELIRDPKKFLTETVWQTCQKRYINTIHNGKIAREIKIKKIQICNSFLEYPKFLAQHIN